MTSDPQHLSIPLQDDVVEKLLLFFYILPTGILPFWRAPKVQPPICSMRIKHPCNYREVPFGFPVN